MVVDAKTSGSISYHHPKTAASAANEDAPHAAEETAGAADATPQPITVCVVDVDPNIRTGSLFTRGLLHRQYGSKYLWKTLRIDDDEVPKACLLYTSPSPRDRG